MEKLKPHYNLADVKKLIADDPNSCTLVETAIRSAVNLGFTIDQSKQCILELENKDFYKSMTSIHNNKVWQDVYKKRIRECNLYIKFKVALIDNKMIVVTSFKTDTSASGS